MINIFRILALLRTHSFITYSFARKHGLKPLIVSTPRGDKTLDDKQVGPIVMHIQGKLIV